MLLNIVKAKAEQGNDINFDISFELDNKFVEEKNYKFLTPANVKGKMKYQNEVLNVNALVSFKILAVCDNCGEEFEKEFIFDFNEKFVEQYNSHDEEDYIIKQTCVEIDKPVYDNLLLNMPTKMLCRKDCKGLCPVCGKDKNLYTCNCDVLMEELENLENPFNQLKKLGDFENGSTKKKS